MRYINLDKVISIEVFDSGTITFWMTNGHSKNKTFDTKEEAENWLGEKIIHWKHKVPMLRIDGD